jgi:hypothetical protein
VNSCKDSNLFIGNRPFIYAVSALRVGSKPGCWVLHREKQFGEFLEIIFAANTAYVDKQGFNLQSSELSP